MIQALLLASITMQYKAQTRQTKLIPKPADYISAIEQLQAASNRNAGTEELDWMAWTQHEQLRRLEYSILVLRSMCRTIEANCDIASGLHEFVR